MPPATTAPRPSLSVLDGAAMLVGIVIGIGIFKTPSVVAANVGSETAFIAAWILGGALTLVGALVYAELAAAFPSTGGEYHFLGRAFGQSVAFLFAWARISVIQTGAIAAVAFVFGDYAQQLHALGAHGSAVYAGAALALLTLVNLRGTAHSKSTQNLFAGLTLFAVLAIALLGLATAGTARPIAPPSQHGGAMGLALIFILLTYGGWNETAYLSGEVRDARRNMRRVLVLGTVAVVVAYVLINLAYLHVLGLQAVRASDAVAADMMQVAVGRGSALLLSAVVCCAAVSTLNGTIFTGARTYHALGEDMPALRRLGLWNRHGNNPRTAVLAQSAIALALIVFGAFTHSGFQAMVEYTAPVFWLFLLLVGIACFVLHRREPPGSRPFHRRWQLLQPAVFCLTCAYLLYSSIAYTGLGALVGVAVLLLGVPLLLVIRHGFPLPAPLSRKRAREDS